MTPHCHSPSSAARRRGFTLVEMMVALGLGSLVLGYVTVMFVCGITNFTGLGNYAMLTGQSRMALDLMSREIRNATQIVSCVTNAPTVTLTLTNAYAATASTLTWNSTSGVVTLDKTGQPTKFLLTGCTAWNLAFYQRTPNNGWTFFTTTDLTLCKLINMSWKCSRTAVRQTQTEYVTTAEVVLRNKP